MAKNKKYLNTSFKSINEALDLGGEKKGTTTTSHSASDGEKFSKQGVGTTGDGVNSDNVEKVVTSGGLSSDDVNTIVKNYQDVYTAVCSAKLSICQKVYKEYMQVIKAHVMSYVGEKVKDEKVADKAQNYTQGQQQQQGGGGQ